MSINKDDLLRKLISQTDAFELKWKSLFDYEQSTKEIPMAVQLATKPSAFHQVDSSNSFITFSKSVCFIYLSEDFSFRPDINIGGRKYDSSSETAFDFAYKPTWSSGLFPGNWEKNLYIVDLESKEYFKIALDLSEENQLVHSIRVNIDIPMKKLEEDKANRLIDKFLNSD